MVNVFIWVRPKTYEMLCKLNCYCYYQLSEFTVIRPLIIFLFSLHLGIQSGPCEDQLIKLDEQCSEKTYKVTSDRISRLLNADVCEFFTTFAKYLFIGPMCTWGPIIG